MCIDTLPSRMPASVEELKKNKASCLSVSTTSCANRQTNRFVAVALLDCSNIFMNELNTTSPKVEPSEQYCSEIRCMIGKK
jgi:hypothetical protein